MNVNEIKNENNLISLSITLTESEFDKSPKDEEEKTTEEKDD